MIVADFRINKKFFGFVRTSLNINGQQLLLVGLVEQDAHIVRMNNAKYLNAKHM